MKSLKFSATVTAILGCFAIMALILTHLALTDIFNQESDTSTEWSVVRFNYAILAAFTISTFITLGLMIKSKVLFPKGN